MSSLSVIFTSKTQHSLLVKSALRRGWSFDRLPASHPLATRAVPPRALGGRPGVDPSDLSPRWMSPFLRGRSLGNIPDRRWSVSPECAMLNLPNAGWQMLETPPAGAIAHLACGSVRRTAWLVKLVVQDIHATSRIKLRGNGLHTGETAAAIGRTLGFRSSVPTLNNEQTRRAASGRQAYSFLDWKSIFRQRAETDRTTSTSFDSDKGLRSLHRPGG